MFAPLTKSAHLIHPNLIQVNATGHAAKRILFDSTTVAVQLCQRRIRGASQQPHRETNLFQIPALPILGPHGRSADPELREYVWERDEIDAPEPTSYGLVNHFKNLFRAAKARIMVDK
jgi:hypothetical protein